MIFVTESVLVATQAYRFGTADPLIPLRHRGERGAPQPKAHNLEHPREAEAKPEKWVALSGIWQVKPAQILAEDGVLQRACALVRGAPM